MFLHILLFVFLSDCLICFYSIYLHVVFQSNGSAVVASSSLKECLIILSYEIRVPITLHLGVLGLSLSGCDA